MIDLSSLDEFRDKEGFITLKRTYSELYKKTLYVSPFTVILNRVYEYDIHAAGFSVLKESGMFSKKTAELLSSATKEERNKRIGLMIRDDKSIGKIKDKGIREARELFFKSNGIQDDEVQAIRNDAIFLIGRKADVTKFGENIEFRLKNVYAAYMSIDKIEFYYDKKHGKIDVKGIADTVVEESDHQNGMLIFFRRVFDYLLLDQRDKLRKYLIQFVRDYKSFNLPHQYYRELNGENIYRTKFDIAGFEYNLTEVSDDDFDIINPIYNFKRYVIPVIQMYI